LDHYPRKRIPGFDTHPLWDSVDSFPRSHAPAISAGEAPVDGEIIARLRGALANGAEE
jgi:hypothetical protein